MFGDIIHNSTSCQHRRHKCELNCGPNSIHGIHGTNINYILLYIINKRFSARMVWSMSAGVNRIAADAENKNLLAALRGEVSDRPPFWLMRQAGRYLPEYRALRTEAENFLTFCYTPDLAVEATLQPIRRFHPDAAILFADILLVPDALGQAVNFREGEGPVLEPVVGVQDLARLGMDGLHDRLAPVYATVRRVAAALPADVALIGFAGAPWTVATYMVEGATSRDHAIVKRWAFADGDGFQQLIDLLELATIAYLKEQIKAGAEVVQLFDTWAGVLPAAAFRRWCLAPVQRIVAALGQGYPEVPVIGFPRGAGVLYGEFARQTGVAAVGLDSTVPLDWARDNLQQISAVQGNLDPQLLVAGGQPMQAAIDEILTALGAGPFVFNLGHGIVPETPPEHVADLAGQVRAWRAR